MQNANNIYRVAANTEDIATIFTYNTYLVQSNKSYFPICTSYILNIGTNIGKVKINLAAEVAVAVEQEAEIVVAIVVKAILAEVGVIAKINKNASINTIKKEDRIRIPAHQNNLKNILNMDKEEVIIIEEVEGKDSMIRVEVEGKITEEGAPVENALKDAKEVLNHLVIVSREEEP